MNKKAQIKSVTFEREVWVLEGSMDGFDFSLPGPYDVVMKIMEALASNTQAREHLAKKTKPKEIKAKEVEKEPAAKASAASAEKKKEPQVLSPASKPGNGSSFAPPTKPVDHRRKRMSADELALFERFQKVQPMQRPKRRTAEENKELDIVRSYLLAEQHKMVIDWTRFYMAKKESGQHPH